MSETITVDMEIALYTGEEDGELKWHSVSLEFYVSLFSCDSSNFTAEFARLKPSSEPKRRSLMYRLLEDIPWYLIKKTRTTVHFRAKVSPDIWTGLEVLCRSHFKLTQEQFNDWMSLKKEALLQQLKAIKVAEDLQRER